MFGMFEAVLGFLQRNVGSREETASASGSVIAQIKNINARISDPVAMGSVKRVIRGTLTSSNSTAYTVSIPAPAIVPEKSLIFLQGHFTFSSNSTSVPGSWYVDAVGATSFQVRTSGTAYSPGASQILSWQVIEFY
jgi:hypothetical protein